MSDHAKAIAVGLLCCLIAWTAGAIMGSLTVWAAWSAGPGTISPRSVWNIERVLKTMHSPKWTCRGMCGDDGNYNTDRDGMIHLCISGTAYTVVEGSPAEP